MHPFFKTQLSVLAVAGGLCLCGCDNGRQKADISQAPPESSVEALSDNDLNAAREVNEIVANHSARTSIEGETGMETESTVRGTNPIESTQQTNTLDPVGQQETVYFSGTEVELDPEQATRLEAFADQIKEVDLSEQEIAVVAFSPTEVSSSTEPPQDSVNADASTPEAELAMQRAETVKVYLQDKGIEAANWNVETMASFNSSTTGAEQEASVIVSVRRYYKPLGEDFD